MNISSSIIRKYRQVGKIGFIMMSKVTKSIECFDGYNNLIFGVREYGTVCKNIVSGEMHCQSQFADEFVNYALDSIDYLIITYSTYHGNVVRILEEWVLEDVRVSRPQPTEEEIRVKAYYIWKTLPKDPFRDYIIGTLPITEEKYCWLCAEDKLKAGIKIEFNKANKGRKRTRTLDSEWVA